MGTLAKSNKEKPVTSTSSLPPIEETKIDLGKLQEQDDEKARQFSTEVGEVLANPAATETSESASAAANDGATSLDDAVITTAFTSAEGIQERPAEEETCESEVIINPVSASAEASSKESNEPTVKDNCPVVGEAVVIKNVAVKKGSEKSGDESEGSSELEDEETTITKL